MRETKKALIVVRTYPTPAKKGVEVSCTAAISDKGEWLRLFPVPYRFLTPDKRFAKYQWIEVTATKATNDPRPESYKIDVDSIKILPEAVPAINAWKARKEILTPLQAPSLCELKRQHALNNFPTLGFFRPKSIDKFSISAGEADWTANQLAILKQRDLFGEGPQKQLEKVPFYFKYHFRCDDLECKGHVISCIDWEMGESWRKWKDEYGDGWEAKFRQRYETDMIENRDTHFYVGTMHGHPKEWIIVGLFYPPLIKEKGSDNLSLPFGL